MKIHFVLFVLFVVKKSYSSVFFRRDVVFFFSVVAFAAVALVVVPAAFFLAAVAFATFGAAAGVVPPLPPVRISTPSAGMGLALRQRGKLLQPRNFPRRLLRMAMGLPHFSQAIVRQLRRFFFLDGGFFAGHGPREGTFWIFTAAEEGAAPAAAHGHRLAALFADYLRLLFGARRHIAMLFRLFFLLQELTFLRGEIALRESGTGDEAPEASFFQRQLFAAFRARLLEQHLRHADALHLLRRLAPTLSRRGRRIFPAPHPIFAAGFDRVQFILHARGEVRIDDMREVLFQLLRHHQPQPGGMELFLFQEDIAPVDDGADGGRVGGRAADAVRFQRFDERGFR